MDKATRKERPIEDLPVKDEQATAVKGGFIVCRSGKNSFIVCRGQK